MRQLLATLFWTIMLGGAGRGSDAPPIIDCDPDDLRANLRSAHEAWRATLPAQPTPLANAIMKTSAVELQKTADEQVSLVITINPEARVKVQPGPGQIKPRLGWPCPVLVKVINESGVTAELNVAIKQSTASEPMTIRFCEIPALAPGQNALSRKLSGKPVEYQVLLLGATKPGKQEITLAFDAGQLTQDLGFRAELPVLLEVSATDSAVGAHPFYFNKTDLLFHIGRDGGSAPIRSTREWETQRRPHIHLGFHEIAGYRPMLPVPPTAVAVQKLEEKPFQGVTLRRIKYLVDQNDWVPAIVLIPAAGKKERLPAILCLHQTTKWGKDEPAGRGGLANLHYALELSQRGYVTISPDYPGYGEYTDCNPYALGYASATLKGIVNHSQAITVLQHMPEVNPERIGCMGHSLGGHNTLFLGLNDSRIKVLASSCGFCAFPKYYGGNLKGWSHKGYMPRIAWLYQSDPRQMPVDFTEILAALAPRPVFVNAPLRDDNFAVEGVRDCARAALPVFELYGRRDHLRIEHPDCGHDFPPDVRERCYQFFDRYLRDRTDSK